VQCGKSSSGGPYPHRFLKTRLILGHYLILGEALTVPQFIAAINQGQTQRNFQLLRNLMSHSVLCLALTLLQRDQYLMMAIQFSRLPFNCEFCDIISLYGRKPRTKELSQTLAELQAFFTMI